MNQSNCCSAAVRLDVCTACKEHCEVIPEEASMKRHALASAMDKVFLALELDTVESLQRDAIWREMEYFRCSLVNPNLDDASLVEEFLRVSAVCFELATHKRIVD